MFDYIFLLGVYLDFLPIQLRIACTGMFYPCCFHSVELFPNNFDNNGVDHGAGNAHTPLPTNKLYEVTFSYQR